MGEWKECKLGDVAKRITSGGTPSTKVKEYYGGDIPWLNTREVNFCRIKDTEQKITELGLKNSSAKWIKAGSVIMAMYGATAGKVAYTKIDLTTNQACCNITVNEKIADNKFIYYGLFNSYNELVNLACGAAQQNLNLGVISDFPLLIPDMLEQRAIASVLSSLDDKIDLLYRQNKTLEAMAETLFWQWFVEEADEGWEKGKLPDEFDFVMGTSPPGDSYNEVGEGVPMYQGNADFEFRFPKKRVFTTEPKRFAEQFDTLISVRAPVGAQNMAEERCCIGRGVAAFRYKNSKKYYTYTYFKMKSLMKEIAQFNDTGTVFGSISKSDFEELTIVIPPKGLVDKYQSEVKPIDDKIISNCMQIRILEKLRETLSPKLMSGEVRVKYITIENVELGG